LAKKHKKAEIKRAPTKRELSRWQRQQRLQRIITLIGVSFIAIILGFIGYGYYADIVRPLTQPVLKVNDRTFDMKYYVKAMELYSLGNEASNVPIFADMTIGRLETNELIRQAAPELGVTASEDEVDGIINRIGLPNDATTKDIIGGELIMAKVVQEYFGEKTPTTCEQALTEAMLLGGKDIAEEMTTKLASGDNFTVLATQFSVEPMTRAKGGDLGWLPKGYSNLILGNLSNSSIEEIAFSIDPQTLSSPIYDESIMKKFGYWIVEILEKDKEKGTHARGILTNTSDKAKEIRNKLLHGEDFATLVNQYSLHEESKNLDGDLGWIEQTSWYQKDNTMEALATEVLKLEPSTISEPIMDPSIETKGGYWLVRVLEREERGIDEETRDIIKSKLTETWLDEQRGKSTIENLLDSEKKAWAIARVKKSIEKQQQPNE